MRCSSTLAIAVIGFVSPALPIRAPQKEELFPGFEFKRVPERARPAAAVSSGASQR